MNTRRKKLVEEHFINVGKAYEQIGRMDAWVNVDKRKAAVLQVLDRAEDDFGKLHLDSLEESVIMFETLFATGVTLP